MRFMSIVVLMIGLISLFNLVGVPAAFSEEDQSIPESYTVTITSAAGEHKVIPDIVSHGLVPEENPIFLSVLVKGGRRLLISVRDRDFEFSEELDRIIQMETMGSEDVVAPVRGD